MLGPSCHFGHRRLGFVGYGILMRLHALLLCASLEGVFALLACHMRMKMMKLFWVFQHSSSDGEVQL